MQIIIPMTGHGSRFKVAGYDRLKPFIHIHNQPMIRWVVQMFPGDENQIVFICQKKHLDTLEYMEHELKKVSPNSIIFPIEKWKKKGPVNDVLCALNMIDDTEPLIVSYCDYYMHWDYNAFKSEVKKRNCDGAIPCYSGFHPHLIPKKNLYADCKVDTNENLIEIREKFSWEKDKTKGLHSSGLYYFKNGGLMKKYYKKMISQGKAIHGEYYASLPYNYLVKDGLKVWCPINISHFCQWGTPEDLEEYLFWVNTIKGSDK